VPPKPPRRRAPDVLPDSLPPPGEPDVLPDSLGRDPDGMPPDSLPPRPRDGDDAVDQT